MGDRLRVKMAGKGERRLLKGSWDLVTRVINTISIPITPLKVLTKSHDPPSRRSTRGHGV